VRAALSRGESQQALERLDAYARKHPRALLGQEAVLLRIEALVQAGRRGSASSLARRFLASQPQSPHRKRIESIVGPIVAPGSP
jgi:outer membrane protein assembly factor BamD (BamD/ComL family)